MVVLIYAVKVTAGSWFIFWQVTVDLVANRAGGFSPLFLHLPYAPADALPVIFPSYNSLLTQANHISLLEIPSCSSNGIWVYAPFRVFEKGHYLLSLFNVTENFAQTIIQPDHNTELSIHDTRRIAVEQAWVLCYKQEDMPANGS